VQNLDIVSHTVCAHVGPKNLGLGPYPFGWRLGWHPRNTPPTCRYMCYHTKICRSRSNRLHVDWSPKNLEDAAPPYGKGEWLTPRNTPLHHVLPNKFHQCGSNRLVICRVVPQILHMLGSTLLGCEHGW